jgi:hypothetical protein
VCVRGGAMVEGEGSCVCVPAAHQFAPQSSGSAASFSGAAGPSTV